MSVTPDRKIIDILKEKKAAGVKTSVSLEYFPPRTADGVKVRASFLCSCLTSRINPVVDHCVPKV